MFKPKSKKAQLTGIIIAAILLLISASLILYIRSTITERTVEGQIPGAEAGALDAASVESYVVNCIETEARPLIKQMSTNGGTLTLPSGDTLKYQNNTYRILCKKENGFDVCINKVVTRESMNLELEMELKNRLQTCLNFSGFKDQGYKVKEGMMDLDVQIGTDDIAMNLNYPVTLTKKEEVVSVNQFSTRLRYPLGKLYELAMTILNAELDTDLYKTHNFDQVKWMEEHGAEIRIEKRRTYPNTVFKLWKTDLVKRENLTFYFAMEGIDTVSMIGSEITPSDKDQALQCCYSAKDKMCYGNALPGTCEQRGLASAQDCNAFACEGISEYSQEELCNGRKCRPCLKTYRWDKDNANTPLDQLSGPSKAHGESWCVYNSLPGNAADYVGSQHYRHYCIDGKEYVEECRDFREEMCVEDEATKQAQCIPNRWQDCFRQADRSSCEDRSKRECMWSTWIDVPGYGSAGGTPWVQNKHCVPYVPPGFRFWSQNGFDVCTWGNDERRCKMTKQFTCPQNWNDANAIYCRSLGDCGNYRNIADEISAGAFLSTHAPPSAAVTQTLYNADNRNTEGAYRKIRLPVNWDQNWNLVNSDNYYANPGRDFAGLMGFMTNYYHDVPDIFDKDKLLSDYIHHQELRDLWIAAFQVCMPYIAPSGGDDCDLCGKEKFQPCTEYACKSLGQLCYYQQIDGIGKCMKPLSSGQGLMIELNETATPLNVTQTTIAGKTGYFVSGKVTDDVNFVVNSNVPSVCKITLLPDLPNGMTFDYFGLKSDYGFSTEHNLTIPIQVIEVTKFMVGDLIGVINTIPFNSVNDIRNFIYSIANQAEQKGDDAEDECDDYFWWDDDGCPYDISGMVSNQANSFRQSFDNNMMPVLTRFFSDQVLGTLKEAAIALNNNRAFVFLECMDRSGARQLGNMEFIGFEVDAVALINPPQPVDVPPTIMYYSPDINSTSAGESTNVELITNQEADCRYDVSDKEFEDMELEFTCTQNGFARCEKMISNTALISGIYIRCADHPVVIRSPQLNLNKSESLALLSGQQGMLQLTDPNQITVINPSLLDPSFVIGIGNDQSSASLTLKFNEQNECYYDYSDKSFEETKSGGMAFANPCQDCMESIPITWGPDGKSRIYMKCKTMPAAIRNPMAESLFYQLK